MKRDKNKKNHVLSLLDQFFVFLQFHNLFYKPAHPESSESCSEKGKKDVRKEEDVQPA